MAPLPALACRIPVHGCRVWWNLEQLYRLLGMESKHDPGRWLQSGWQRWENFLVEQLRLSSMHLVKKGSSIQGEAKVADSRMISIAALVGLLVRWVSLPCNHGGMSGEDGAKLRAVLECMIKMFAQQPEEEHITIYQDPHCTWQPPAWPSGSSPLLLLIKDGCVQLPALGKLSNGFTFRWLESLRSCGLGLAGPVPLMALMCASIQCSANRDGQCMGALRQLIWWLAAKVDTLEG
eukprot:10370252-Lingulodinium_polyedra.AAC.1